MFIMLPPAFYGMVASLVAESDAVSIPQISFTVFGEVVTHNLKPKGDRIPVTKENREGMNLVLPLFLLNKLLWFWVNLSYGRWGS